jgi:hypothetical protein
LGSNTAIASIIQSINAPINNKIYYFGTTPHNDADFEVADLYSAFAAYDKPEKLIHYKYDTLPKRAVLHPTTKGYESIYNVFNELMD